MRVEKFREAISRLKKAFGSLDSGSFEEKSKELLFDFTKERRNYFKASASTAVKEVETSAWELTALGGNESNKEKILELLELAKQLGTCDKEQINGLLDKMLLLSDKLVENKQIKELKIKAPVYVPQDIKQDVLADIAELEKCFNSKCYRSSTIICGRILETALHRKYYEATGVDILEKNPGIGLGKLIAKLVEKNISFDPGLTQQIHLINQIRINSVHRKREMFYPTQQQTYAMILYTLDVLEKIFKKNKK